MTKENSEAHTIKVAVLGSTRGTDLQAILDAQAAGTLPGAEVNIVISNRPQAYILERAQQAQVEALVIPSKGRKREEFEKELLLELQKRQIDLIVLIGFMRILTPSFVEHYPDRIMNIHPSLLPKYSGGMNMNIHEEVLKNGDTVTGCTLHYVTSTVDEGPIIMQKEVPVESGDTPESLKDKVQVAEQQVLVQGIIKFAEQHQSSHS